MENMKKLNLLAVLVVIIMTIISCSKDTVFDPENVQFKDAYVLNRNSSPISTSLVIPVTLAVDKPRGGNVSCTDVEQAFETDFDLCGDKRNYGNYDSDPDLEFDGSFPDWLEVTVTDGKYISFSVKNYEETCYQVGAVIVKGGNSANVYFYEDGTIGDSGLAAPINSSTYPADLSNLTFCFYECPPDEIELVIAYKAVCVIPYSCETGNCYTYFNAVSSGDIYPFTYEWSTKLGIRFVDDGDVYEIVNLDDPTIVVGNIKVTEYWSESGTDHFLKVEINAKEGTLLYNSYLYVGPLKGLEPFNIWPTYMNWPFKIIEKPLATHTFTINYNSFD